MVAHYEIEYKINQEYIDAGFLDFGGQSIVGQTVTEPDLIKNIAGNPLFDLTKVSRVHDDLGLTEDITEVYTLR